VRFESRLRKLEKILPTGRPRVTIVVLAGDDRAVSRVDYSDGTEESPQGLTLDDLPTEDLEGTLVIGGVDDAACLGRKVGEGAPPSMCLECLP
jgi:hypothetical protein